MRNKNRYEQFRSADIKRVKREYYEFCTRKFDNLNKWIDSLNNTNYHNPPNMKENFQFYKH